MEFKGREYAFLSTTYGSYNADYDYKKIGPKTLFKVKKEELLKLSDPNLHTYIEGNIPEEFNFTNIDTPFLALRTDNLESFIKILNSPDAFIAKKISREAHPRTGWTAHRDGIMKFLIVRKFVSNPELAERLCKITCSIKYENNYNDYYWGVCKGKGSNMLGRILSDTRKMFMERKIEAFNKRLGLTTTKTERDRLINTFCETYNVSPELFLGKDEVENTKGGKTITFKNNEKSILTSFFEKLEKDGEFFVVDTETSGVNPRFADVIELSAIRVNKDFEIVDEFDTFINPGYNLPPEIIEFNEKNGTGIDDALLSAAPKPKAAFKAFKEYVGEDPIIIGHNIPFDIRFINKLSKRTTKEDFAPSCVVDTLKMAREKVPAPHKLGVLYEQIPDAPDLTFHKSIDDIKATLEVLKWLIPMYDNRYELVNSKLQETEIKAPSLSDFLR